MHAAGADLPDPDFRLDAAFLATGGDVLGIGGEELDLLPDEAKAVRHFGLLPIERIGHEGRSHRGRDEELLPLGQG